MASAESLVGSILDGKYQVERILGRGGMGEVYAGTHLQLERPVAIKVMHGDLASDETFAARFAREARTAARLEHPNAVHVYDFGALSDGSAYLVMEFVEGVTLREVLRANGRFSPLAALEFLRQAAGAVGAAHARGIVHRDLKPENIMVRTDETGHAVLKVVDFGLAKILENSTSQLTNKSELMGTPRYMAPEQFNGGRVDERVDVYALGCMLFEMLTGRPPFEGTFIEIVGKHVYADLPSFSSMEVEVDSDIEAVVRHALEKDPDKRTPSAAEIVRELEFACAGRTEQIAPPTIPLASPRRTAPGQVFSEIATRLEHDDDPEEHIETRLSRPLAPEEDLRTRYAEPDREDEATRVRQADPPTVVVPNALAAPEVDPQTRVMRPGRKTAVDLEPPAEPSRRRWAAPVAVGMALVLTASTFGYWISRPSAPQPAPVPSAGPPVVAPAPSATEKPAAEEPKQPVEEPSQSPDAAQPQAPVAAEAPKPAPKPAPRSRTAVTPDPEDVPDPPDVPEIPDNAVDDNDMPTAEQLREARRLLKEIERRRRAKAAARRTRPRP